MVRSVKVVIVMALVTALSGCLFPPPGGGGGWGADMVAGRAVVLRSKGVNHPLSGGVFCPLRDKSAKYYGGDCQRNVSSNKASFNALFWGLSRENIA